MESEQESDDMDGKYGPACLTDDKVAERRAKACEERGTVVVSPEPDQLFIDIDSHAGLGMFHANVGSLGELVKTTMVKPSPSKRAGHYHITVRLSRAVKDSFERIMLQALLGSDLSREIISWREATNGCSAPTVFFEKVKKNE